MPVFFGHVKVGIGLFYCVPLRLCDDLVVRICAYIKRCLLKLKHVIALRTKYCVRVALELTLRALLRGRFAADLTVTSPRFLLAEFRAVDWAVAIDIAAVV